MAHECPECGNVCHCGSDIDDLILNFDEDVNSCTCCVGKENDEEDYDEYGDYDADETDD